MGVPRIWNVLYSMLTQKMPVIPEGKEGCLKHVIGG